MHNKHENILVTINRHVKQFLVESLLKKFEMNAKMNFTKYPQQKKILFFMTDKLKNNNIFNN